MMIPVHRGDGFRISGRGGGVVSVSPPPQGAVFFGTCWFCATHTHTLRSICMNSNICNNTKYISGCHLLSDIYTLAFNSNSNSITVIIFPVRKYPTQIRLVKLHIHHMKTTKKKKKKKRSKTPALYTYTYLLYLPTAL